MKCISYSTEIENNFYTELFSTDFRGYDSAVQNAKTDILCDNSCIDFEDWLDELVDCFADENEFDSDTIKKSLSTKFIDDMRFEFEDLKSFLPDDEDED
jgi:hypothetical protein